MLDCQLRSWWFKSPSGQTPGSRFLTNCAPCKLSYSYNEYTDCTLSGEVQRVRERIGHLLSYANAKKMKLLTLHTSGCLRVSLRDCSSLLLNQLQISLMQT